eukprot:14202-Hanusia_phi.AAC.1
MALQSVMSWPCPAPVQPLPSSRLSFTATRQIAQSHPSNGFAASDTPDRQRRYGAIRSEIQLAI